MEDHKDGVDQKNTEEHGTLLDHKKSGANHTIHQDDLERPNDVTHEKSRDRASYLALEGGWGWMCVLGCSSMHFLLGGMSRTYGIVYLQLMDRFRGSAAVTAWVGGVGTALRMGMSPLATMMCNRFGTRSTVFVGGLLMGASHLLSADPPNLNYMFFSYSLFSGVGGTLTYTPALVMVAQYFSKRRALAIGMSTAGSGLGVFIFPPMLEFLFEKYSYFGTMLIMAGILFNGCVCGLLYRPLEDNRAVRKKLRILQNENLLKHDSSPRSNGTFESKTDVETDPSTGRGCCKSLCHKIKGDSKRESPLLDMSILKNGIFVVYGLTMVLSCICYVSGQMFIPAIAVRNNCSTAQAALLLSILGISDTSARIASGFIFDLKMVRKYRIYCYIICLLLTGITIGAYAFATDFPSFIIVSVAHGVAAGFIVGQRSVILVDLIGVRQIPSAIGFMAFFQGIGVLVGPVMAGLIKDISGSYAPSFYFSGAAGIASGLLLYVGMFVRRFRKRNQPQMNSPSVNADL